MKRLLWVPVVATLWSVPSLGWGQPPEGEVEFGRRPPPPRKSEGESERDEGRKPEGRYGDMEPSEAFREMIPSAMALFFALDTNRDKVLSAEEIANSSKALLKLDQDGDGKLSADELKPDRTMMMTGMGRPGAKGNPPPPPGNGGNAEMMVNRLKEMDKDGDGFLSREEVPERLGRNFDRADADQDGKLSPEEVRRVVRVQLLREEGGSKENQPGDAKPGDQRPIKRRPDKT